MLWFRSASGSYWSSKSFLFRTLRASENAPPERVPSVWGRDRSQLGRLGYKLGGRAVPCRCRIFQEVRWLLRRCSGANTLQHSWMLFTDFWAQGILKKVFVKYHHFFHFRLLARNVLCSRRTWTLLNVALSLHFGLGSRISSQVSTAMEECSVFIFITGKQFARNFRMTCSTDKKCVVKIWCVLVFKHYFSCLHQAALQWLIDAFVLAAVRVDGSRAVSSSMLVRHSRNFVCHLCTDLQ